MIYNVRGTVVDLIDADSADGAIAELRGRLVKAGFDPYDDVGTFDAFESEELT